MEIRAGSEDARRVLQASVDGSLDVLKSASDHVVKSARCTTGCTSLHWAAGSNQVAAIECLVKEKCLDVDIPATKKARGRTPLHYACRNGCLEAARLLVQLGADVDARAKHNVSPFQLAVWQNNIDICRWLVDEQRVDPSQLNEFDCGAVHWIGISPLSRADKGLLPLAKWLAQQPGINFQQRQRQGHTPLHKAAWGGHMDLIEYLRDEHGLLDDVQDFAGNYAADLADMANTKRHAQVAQFLRRECSAARANSCAILGVPVGSSTHEIRKAYLEKARLLHPDRNKCNSDFDELHKAYKHLTTEDGNGFQSNPAHSLNLMLELSGTGESTLRERDDIDCFKARLIAVLLEYGDKGLDLCNVKKKWKQVWPDKPFPDGMANAAGQNKKMSLSDIIRLMAGDAVDIVVPESGKGSIRVIPKHCTQAQVANLARDRREDAAEIR